ncbi:hypothetical protein HYE59_02265 [Aggregatibacter actinomycetemcomitans]|uniref:T6SS effector amidase Tae4 family protein n=2 Tax=Aggregatibacter actinomycetemcomitans TaxID=714 RepID=UPI00197B6FF0|nr:T6SS effector amidase Tae4 family protein [Aggregatibacter actinomycetemcomitans]MBN6076391.1 hypothetical protein [Aggregatibacter actinomycetemcomitans]
MGANINTRSGKVQRALNVARPSWNKVYEGYPKVERNGMIDDLDAHSVFTSIFGKDYDSSTFGNACATRLSLGLLNAGVKIRGEYPILQGPFKGKSVIVSAANMVKWLNNNFGKPEETIPSPKEYRNIVDRIGNRKGIYAMKPNSPRDFRASGHVTLWVNGNVIGGEGHSYYKAAFEIYFWELK